MSWVKVTHQGAYELACARIEVSVQGRREAPGSSRSIDVKARGPLQTHLDPLILEVYGELVANTMAYARRFDDNFTDLSPQRSARTITIDTSINTIHPVKKLMPFCRWEIRWSESSWAPQPFDFSFILNRRGSGGGDIKPTSDIPIIGSYLRGPYAQRAREM